MVAVASIARARASAWLSRASFVFCTLTLSITNGTSKTDTIATGT
jgi:hypothetical protein